VTAWQDAVEPGLYPIGDERVSVLVAEQPAPTADADGVGDKRVVGVGWVSSAPDSYLGALDVDGELGGLYVDPAVSRAGVGTHLCDRLETVAVQRGCTRLGLWASLNAVPFYRTRGYQRGADRTIEYNSASLPVVEMEQSLTPAHDAGECTESEISASEATESERSDGTDRAWGGAILAGLRRRL
jgi:putative acetyltransferase